MDFYFFIILITELMMLGMILHVLHHQGFAKKQKIWFILAFFSVMFCAAAELAALHFNGRGKAFVVPLTISTAIEFALAVFLPLFLSAAIGIHRPLKIMGFVFSVHALAQIVSAPFGWIFYFDETGTYFRGDCYIIYEGFYVIGLVFLVISLLVVGQRFKQRDFSTIVMVLVILAVGVCSAIFFRIYTDYLAIGISGCLCYIYYNDLIQLDTKAAILSSKEKLGKMQAQIIDGLANLIDSRNTENTESHSRVGEYVKAIAESARERGAYTEFLDDYFIAQITTLAPMHDVGKIVVSDQILNNPGKLTEAEFEQVKLHASMGETVIRQALSGITDEEYLKIASDLASYHHEWWDGSGYPKGLSGEAIPLSARIMAIADVYDALITDRCYKKAISPEAAKKVIRSEAGTHFDPVLVDAFLSSAQGTQGDGSS